jgi:hypothetical protein
MCFTVVPRPIMVFCATDGAASAAYPKYLGTMGALGRRTIMSPPQRASPRIRLTADLPISSSFSPEAANSRSPYWIDVYASARSGARYVRGASIASPWVVYKSPYRTQGTPSSTTSSLDPPTPFMMRPSWRIGRTSQ